MFWPRDIWGCYGSTLADFKEPANRRQAVRCLNHMVSRGGRASSAQRCIGGWR